MVKVTKRDLVTALRGIMAKLHMSQIALIDTLLSKTGYDFDTLMALWLDRTCRHVYVPDVGKYGILGYVPSIVRNGDEIMHEHPKQETDIVSDSGIRYTLDIEYKKKHDLIFENLESKHYSKEYLDKERDRMLYIVTLLCHMQYA